MRPAPGHRTILFGKTKCFWTPLFPMYFIERKYCSDPTNWWIPNRSAAEAMLRSAGLKIISHPEHETWICQPESTHRNGRYVVDLEFAGELAPEEEEGEDLHGGSRNAVE